MTSLDSYSITISDIKLFNPQTTFPKAFYTFRIEITDSNKKLIKSAEGASRKDRVIWKEQISLSEVSPESTIVFKVLKKMIGRMKPIGEYSNSVSYFLKMQEASDVCQIELGKKTQLNFTIEASRLQNVVEDAIERIENIDLNEGDVWSKFFTYFQLVKNAIDPVSQLNPYFQQVWSILSAVPKIIQTHLTRNSNINKLVQRLLDIYKFIVDAKRLPALTTTQSQNMKLLIQQSLECAYFIKEYAERNTVEKIWKGPIVDNKIQEFTEKFNQLFDAIRNSSILETNIVTLRVSQAVGEIKDSGILGEMPYASNAGFAAGKRCLPGTQQKLISEILDWVNNYVDTPQRYFVLNGQAGMGKSSVAHTIAEIFRTQNRLGSLFCFSRNDIGRINLLFSTISRDLADSDASWQKSLIQAIREAAIRKSLDPTTQFNELIIKPSKDAGTIGPVVIIIDALDESGDRLERKVLLDLLFERGSELPGNYRFIITSRPEPDIEERYRLPTAFCKHMAHINSDDTLNDIRQFVSHKLTPMAKVLDEELKLDWRLLLANKAQGLFQWANLACLFINPAVKIGLAQRLRTVASKSTSSIYELYHQILDALPEFQVDGFSVMFQTVIGALVVSRKPLTISALQALFGPDIEGVTVDDVLLPFHSLFIGADNPATQIRPLHTSLFDFFTNAEQKPGTPNRFYIDTSDQSLVTRACLRLMNGMLRFNMCQLESSHLHNRDVPNFDLRVAEVVPLHLSYACCFWASHLKDSSFNPEVSKEIRHLMHANLLYFFEALSLLGEVEHGRDGMQILKDQVKDKDSELADQAADASLFASQFGEMTESTPHLYLSALPCTPNQSFISKQFIPQYPQLLSFDSETQGRDWDFGNGVDSMSKTELREIWLKGPHFLLLVCILGGVGNYFQILHTTEKQRLRVKIGESHAGVRAVSPEDNHWSLAYIGSGGLCLWGIDSKRESILDKSGHNITKLAFSATGDRLIGSDSRGNIKIWDVRTRQLISVGKLSSLSVEWVNAVAFSSMDFTFLVAYTTSNNKILIEIQDCESRAILKGPFESFTPMQSIVSTVNDTRIVCRSALRLEILDISTGKSRCFDTVGSNISPNRKYVAWAPIGDKNKVKFWDLDRDTVLDGPSFNYRVNRCDFSTDSARVSVLYGADKGEGRVSIWDIEGGRSVMRPFPCITDCWPSIPHVALQGDSLFLASDKDLGKMWDLRVLEIMSHLYDNHLNTSHFGMLPIDNLENRRLIENYRSSHETINTLDYALVAWNNGIFSRFTKINQDGWVLGPRDELLFWIPKSTQKRLWLPCMTYMNEKEFIKPNFDKFVHGTRWMECKSLI